MHHRPDLRELDPADFDRLLLGGGLDAIGWVHWEGRNVAVVGDANTPLIRTTQLDAREGLVGCPLSEVPF